MQICVQEPGPALCQEQLRLSTPRLSVPKQVAMRELIGFILHLRSSVGDRGFPTETAAWPGSGAEQLES